jgi:LmbE family N-acetylglucosaminyl deacetylase
MSDPLSRPILVLSPHLDDAILSCGGLLAGHSNALVVTAFSADPPQERPSQLSAMASPEVRREEDARAMERVGAQARLLNMPDAIDRIGADGERLYPKIAALFGVVAREDAPICEQIVQALAPLAEERIVLSPMAIGAHVDHQLCAHAGRRLQAAGHEVLFYEDAPYVYPNPGKAVQGDSVIRAAGRLRARVKGLVDVAIDDIAKSQAVACYATQVTELFGDMASYSVSAQGHFAELGGEIERFHHLRF